MEYQSFSDEIKQERHIEPERNLKDVLEGKTLKSALEILRSTKDSKLKKIIVERYAPVVLYETRVVLYDKPWTREYQNLLYRFLLEIFSSDVSIFNVSSSYMQLVFLYIHHYIKNNALFDYLRKIFDHRFNEDVDLVYLWCDNSDPKWCKKREEALKKANPNWTANGQDKSRTTDNNELKYSLRSVEMYAPWIHKIYIITDGQIPSWLNTSNKKIKIVDHKDIMPSKILPCFNSNVIESCIHHIKGLSEYFLLANDDTFFGAPVTKDFFFSSDGKPYARFHKMPNFSKTENSPYYQTLTRMAHLYEEKSGKKYYLNPHHNIDAYTKTLFKNSEKLFANEWKIWQQNQFRTAQDFQRVLILYQAIGEKTAIRKRSCLVDSAFFRLESEDIAQTLHKYHPKIFCINDNEKATDVDREEIRKLYQKLFPYKSSFEK